MALFIDTGDIREIEQYHRMGIIRGVTTNPTILVKHGVKSRQELKCRSVEIANLVAPYPVSVEVTSNERSVMLEQAQEFASWAENINVKITIHGPCGEIENLAVIHELETKHSVRVNVTAMMSAQQCLLAAMAGASFVSIFGGRINNMGYQSVAEIAKLREVLDLLKLDAKIIVGSTREILNVIEWIHAGAHIVTVTPDLIKGMIVHPYSKETVRMFLEDGAKIKLD